MTTLRELRAGALLHILVALLIHGPSTNDELRRLTGWSSESIHDALDVLKREPFELVAAYPNGRWPTWSLTSHAEQVFPSLWRMSPLNADSTGSSGSSLTITPKNLQLLPPMSPLEADSSSTDPPPEAQTITDQLTRLGCTPRRAAKAINAALRRGEQPTPISRRISQITAYIDTQHTIRYPGEYAAQFIEAGAQLPDLPATGQDYSGYRPYLATNSEEEERG